MSWIKKPSMDQCLLKECRHWATPLRSQITDSFRVEGTQGGPQSHHVPVTPAVLVSTSTAWFLLPISLSVLICAHTLKVAPFDRVCPSLPYQSKLKLLSPSLPMPSLRPSPAVLQVIWQGCPYLTPLVKLVLPFASTPHSSEKKSRHCA